MLAITLYILKFNLDDRRSEFRFSCAVQLIAKIVMQVSAEEGGIADVRDILRGERAYGLLARQLPADTKTEIVEIAHAMAIWPEPPLPG